MYYYVTFTLLYLHTDKPLFKSDPAHPDISYFTGEVIEEVITPGKDQQVVVGEKEDLGFKARLSGTVPIGKNVTFMVEAVFRAKSSTPPSPKPDSPLSPKPDSSPSPKPDTPTAQDKTDAKHEPVNVVPEPTKPTENLEPVSLMYAINASGAELLEKILVEIAHSAVIETNEDKEKMVFVVFRLSDKDSVNSTLEFAGFKTGEFQTNSEGDPIGIVELEISDLDKKLFIELARKILLSLLPTVSMSPSSSQTTTTPDQTQPAKSKGSFDYKKDVISSQDS